MRLHPLVIPLALSLGFGSEVPAQEPIRIETEKVECLQVGENGVAWATVENNIPDTTVRLYFRRLNESVEDLYWVRMVPAGKGRYWGVFPKAEDQVLKRHDLTERRQELIRQNSWAEWWRAKDGSDDRNPNSDLDQEVIRERASQGKLEKRDWLAELSDQEFQQWLEKLENEPAEYYTSVHDWQGQRLAKSPTQALEVRKNCPTELTPAQQGEAENLTVGETAYWQRDEAPFHWLCAGIVSRLDPTAVLRGDNACRACVVAWWKKPALLIPAAVGVGTVTGIVLIDDKDPRPASPIRP
jgi:hypothetical protein